MEIPCPSKEFRSFKVIMLKILNENDWFSCRRRKKKIGAFVVVSSRPKINM